MKNIIKVTLVISLIFLNNNLFSQCDNVALGKPATASAVYLTEVANNAFDGNCSSIWLCPGFATQWIQVDLQGTFTIKNINLRINMSPNGACTYNLYSAPVIGGPWSLIETVSGSFTDNQLIQRCYTTPLSNVGAIKVETTASPSWISWREIGVYALATTPTITPNGPLVFCQGGNVILTANSGSSYLWSNGATTQTISVNSSGVYSVVVGSTPGPCTAGTNTCTTCSNTSAVTVTVNPSPTISVNSGTICSGQSFTINPSGANTYTYQGGNAVVTPTANSTYTVVGTSSLGCISQSFATSGVTVNANPTISVNSGSICLGQSFTLNPSGASTYTYEGGNAVVSPTANTTYTVVGTSSLGCVSQSFAVSSITVNANPIISVNSGSICLGQSFTINPTGANTYTIQGGNVVVNPTVNTTYTVVGTSSLGCVSQSFATSGVTVNPNPTISVNSGSICAGQSFTLTPSGASSYTIQGGSAVVSPTLNTSYTVSGTSTAGCVSQGFATSTLSVVAIPTVNIVGTNTICQGETIILNANGADTYSWNIGGITSSISMSPSVTTVYTVIGTSTVSGCVGTATFNILVDPCTGIFSNHISSEGISLFPNPTNGDFTIKLSQSADVVIYNNFGQTIYNEKLQSGATAISLRLFPSGVYTIQFNDSKRKMNYRIIKQ